MLAILVPPKSEEKLLAAHWPITFVEYLLLRIGLMVVVFLLVWLITTEIIPGIILAVLIFFIPNLAMEWSIKNRKNKFDKQLIDDLVLLTGGIRAGFSFLQAMDHVVKEMPPPISVELNRVTQEVRLGVSLKDALSHLADRMDNKDLNLVVTTIVISQRVGGNMTEMMEIVTETIRTRTRLFSEVQSLTSNQRFTGQLLTFLPAIVAGVLFLINPSYMGNLFKPELIWLPIGALIMILIGNIIVRRLVKFDF
jgi:tight adherence protein B